jgi:murein DD-endopeptidase MepM/ murein hydrolase activator NlpD
MLTVVLVGASAPAWPQPASGALRLPVSPACVSSPFGWRHAVGPHAPAGFHNGVDLPAPAGATVRAAAPGRVARIERRGIGGLQVVLQHDGYQTLYAHLGTLTPALAEGKRQVAAGEPIARIGRTGITYGTHLFFEVLANGRPVDAAPLLGVKPCEPTGSVPLTAMTVPSGPAVRN